ncbi:shikimate kinase [Leptospira perolatii]|uniref:Shikimate kinase n=1 Tax=Leptospira perolatii TaxID=2023191 RepID=A0A2M9ZP69_9LEPT|nr:shikimate kinase [Leptospira perolatii]PJZ70667.1 shikimate kinase [Leptospira perolatii]PJZ73878.1 shikimate kinase [Leptospira perolatii]
MKNISLIGPRGVGKSKISRRLSKITGRPVLSTDMIAVYENGGIAIPDFIKKSSGDWRPFRELEFRILERIQNSDGIILDCGGGILFDLDSSGREIPSERKIQLLRKISIVFSLSRPIDFLIEKVQNDPTRPSLSNEISYRNLLESRLPHYRASSDVQLNLGDRKTEDICDEILKRASWI